MKVVVCLDTDGHFQTVDLLDRKNVWNLITKIVDDGDYWENSDEKEEYENWNYEEVESNEWIEFVENFVQRGTVEIVDLNIKKMKLNPDFDYVKEMRESLKERNGYCPCLPKYMDSDDTKCPCKEFREYKSCRCKLYVEDN